MYSIYTSIIFTLNPQTETLPGCYVAINGSPGEATMGNSTGDAYSVQGGIITQRGLPQGSTSKGTNRENSHPT